MFVVRSGASPAVGVWKPIGLSMSLPLYWWGQELAASPPSQGWSGNLFHTPLLSFSQPSPTCGGISRDKPFALLLLPLVTRPSPELARSKYARSVKGVVDGEPGVLVVLAGLDRPCGYQRLKWALRQHRPCSFAFYAHVVPVEKVLFSGQQLISLTKFSCRQ